METAMKITFIGNSHTYVNLLPYQVKFLLETVDKQKCEIRMVTVGGKSLGWHADQPNTQAAIKYHPADIIVLQQATHPWAGKESLMNDYNSLEPFLDENPANVYLYMTWARKDKPEDQPEIDESLEHLAAEKSLTKVPVSIAWQKVVSDHPDIELYSDDGSHAGEYGTYLAACTFYSVITGNSPIGLPCKTIIHKDILADIPKENAEAMQKIIADVCGTQ